MKDADPQIRHRRDSRQRDALQGGRPVACGRLQDAREGRRPGRHHPGDADHEHAEGAGRAGDDQDAIGAGNQKKGVQLVATTLLNPPATAGGGGLDGIGGRDLTRRRSRRRSRRARTVYKELCFACHGDDGRGAPAPDGSAAGTRAPALAASPRVVGHRDYVIKALLHGLTGPVNGVTYTEVMIPMGAESRRVDCRGRLVHPQRVRQSRVDDHRRRRRPRPRPARRAGRRPWTRGGDRVRAAADGDRRQRLEGHRQPQLGDRLGRVEHPAMDVRAARRRRACGCRSSCRSRSR